MEGGITGNARFVDEQYARYREDAASVTPEWRAFFEGFELASRRPGMASDAVLELQCKAEAVVYRYRDLGHLMSCLDPLTVCPTSHPLLELPAFGLTPEHLEREVRVPSSLGPPDRMPLKELVDRLRDTYCRGVGVEYMHLQDPDERGWLRDRMEPTRNRPVLGRNDRIRAYELLVRTTRFEQYLQKRYPGQTRFSLEGAETLIPLLHAALVRSGSNGATDVVFGMAHRGRLSVQTILLNRSFHDIFCAFEASYDAETVAVGGDVKYHDGYRGTVEVDGRVLRVVLPENPSHLEVVNPVVAGVARALQDRVGTDGATKVVPLMIHGDGAFMGQGVVAETLNLSHLEGYGTGGTLHVVLNNQIGYTTLPENARSTRYATDVAKMLMVPVFHVHGESPETAVHAMALAADYRHAFGKDAVVDLVCYRRHGHNEGDEPYFTQPTMYQRIRKRPPVHRLYGDVLVEQGVLTETDRKRIEAGVDERLEAAHEAARSEPCVWRLPEPLAGWEGIGSTYRVDPPPTGVESDRLAAWADRLWSVPEGFELHPILKRVIGRRLEAFTAAAKIDWAGAEALAFASLVAEGTPVRLSGEDSRRGTFSQRHCVWFDTRTGTEYCPLEHVREDQAPFLAWDSPLSEVGVLGFEYGYATVDAHGLVLWEAQYGDFANGAQVVIDQFVASAEAKWRRRAGLVMLLPHGYEGAGPDHSTARLERFLQLCAEDNLLVVQPTTPAQYFHLLRRQVKATYRKPLVVMAPKSLLRHPKVISGLADLTGGRFRTVLDDCCAEPSRVRRVFVCTGKVAYDLEAAQEERGADDLAIVRLEQLHPFPEDELARIAARYPGARWQWVQEEPKNMGAWTFVSSRLADVLGDPVSCTSRPAAASPATGFGFIHRQEQKALMEDAFGDREQ